MNSIQNRLMFAICVLEQEEGADQILSDLLEQDGERGLADWARAKKSSWSKRLDFVLGILSDRLTLRLTSDFLAYSFSIVDGIDDRFANGHGYDSESLKDLIAAVKVVSDWAAGREPNSTFSSVHLVGRKSPQSTGDAGEAVLEQALLIISNVGNFRFGIMNIDLTMQAFHLAVSSSRSVEFLEGTKQAHQAAQTSLNACRKIVKATRSMLQPFHVFEMQKTKDVSPEFPHELAEWQTAHAIRVLKKELESLG